jgi:hypothetical protein
VQAMAMAEEAVEPPESNTRTNRPGLACKLANFRSYIVGGISHHRFLHSLPSYADVVADPKLLTDMFLLGGVPAVTVWTGCPDLSRGWMNSKTTAIHDKPGLKHLPGLLSAYTDPERQAVLWLDAYGFMVHSSLSRRLRRQVLQPAADALEMPLIAPSYYKVDVVPLPWKRYGKWGVELSGRKAPVDLPMLVHNAIRMARLTLKYFTPVYQRKT